MKHSLTHHPNYRNNRTLLAKSNNKHKNYCNPLMSLQTYLCISMRIVNPLVSSWRLALHAARETVRWPLALHARLITPPAIKYPWITHREPITDNASWRQKWAVKSLGGFYSLYNRKPDAYMGAVDSFVLSYVVPSWPPEALTRCSSNATRI